MRSLFGEEINDPVPKKPGQANGYAAPPGTGPKGETCGTCRHIRGFRQAGSWYKCGLMEKVWTGGRGTDILKRSPACRFWEKEKP